MSSPHHRTPSGKFAEKPEALMPMGRALELMGSPPRHWEPYFHQEAAWSLYRNGLALLAQKRQNGRMVRLWKAAQ